MFATIGEVPLRAIGLPSNQLYLFLPRTIGIPKWIRELHNDNERASSSDNTSTSVEISWHFVQ